LHALVQQFSGYENIDEEALRTSIRHEYRAALRRKFPQMPECRVRQYRAMTNKTVRYYADTIREYIRRDQHETAMRTPAVASEDAPTCSTM
jgi:hypothetical protein